MKSDISISVSELGSLLDHSGPHKEAEEYIARVLWSSREPSSETEMEISDFMVLEPKKS